MKPEDFTDPFQRFVVSQLLKMEKAQEQRHKQVIDLLNTHTEMFIAIDHRLDNHESRISALEEAA